MAAAAGDENAHRLVHADDVDIEKLVDAVEHAYKIASERAASDVVEHTEIVPRFVLDEPVKRASGVPLDMPCALAVVKTPGAAAVTDAITIGVPAPSTK